MLRLNSSDPGFAEAFQRLVRDRRESDEDVARDVASILNEVKLRGDAAVAEYTAKFDGHTLGTGPDDDIGFPIFAWLNVSLQHVDVTQWYGWQRRACRCPCRI